MIHQDGSRGPYLDPCFCGKLDVRPYPDADDDQVRLELSVPELHAPDTSFAGELIDLLARVDADTVGCELGLHVLRDLGSVGEGDPVLAFDQGDLHPEPAQVLSDLQPDVAPSDYRRLAGGLLLDVSTYLIGVRQEAELEDAFEIGAGNGGGRPARRSL